MTRSPRSRRFALILSFLGLIGGGLVAPPGADAVGPDVPATTPPVATIVAFSDEVFSFTESPRTTTVDVPDIDFDRVVVELSSRPDGDPWDRLFGVSIGGVEVLRGTTPRAAFTVRKDITELLPLLPRGGTAEVSLLLSTYVGSQLGSVRVELFRDATSAVVDTPARAVVPALRWRSLSAKGEAAAAAVTFPDAPPASATAVLTITGHGEEEFWYQNGAPLPRTFRVRVDGVEVGTAVALPYVYALLGFSGAIGEVVHPVMWWSVHQGLDVAGVHTGVGEIPAYRIEIAPEHRALLQGARTVDVVRDQGIGGFWVTSLAFTLR